MPFSINWEYLNYLIVFFSSAPPQEIYLYLFTHGGWLIILYVFYKFFLKFYFLNRYGSFLGRQRWIFLAIDIPKGNEQTPKAVEQIFAHLAGCHKRGDLEDVFLGGYKQLWFSFEIVSIEGYTQFIIGLVQKYRDLVESAVYAQYPDAEITEIEDYAKEFPGIFPNKENYILWGTEFIPTNKEQSFPIRTYSDFEHSAAEDVFKDPMAALLESLTHIGKGEFAGLQILVKPINSEWNNWKKHGNEFVQKMIGAAVKQKSTLLSKVGALPGQLLDTTVTAVGGMPVGIEVAEKKDAPPSLMLHLPPEYKENVAKVERKISKICFATKIRFIYLAKKDIYNRARVSYGVTGAIKQYSVEDLNGLKPEMGFIGTHMHYFFKTSRLNWRRTRLINAYKSRSRWRGALEYLMNIEELASLWHFPMLTVKAPLLARTDTRRGQPPSTLPTEREGAVIKAMEKKQKGAPPPDLPV